MRHFAISFVLFAFSGSFGCGGSVLPPAAITHNTEGATRLQEGDLDGAEARFRLALEYQPRFAEAHANLGLVARARGDLAAAERHLRDALSVAPELTHAWSDLGVVLADLGRDHEAREAFERALSIDPGHAGARRNLAQLLVRGGAIEAARAHLFRLTAVDPEDTESASWLAWCDLRLDRPNAAFERAEEVLEKDPEAYAARVVRGAARARRHDLDGAIDDLVEARTHPEVAHDATTRLAAVLVIRGDLDAAAALVIELLRETPEDASVRLVAAALALGRGDASHARAEAARALEIQPALSQAQDLLQAACSLGARGCAASR